MREALIPEPMPTVDQETRIPGTEANISSLYKAGSRRTLILTRAKADDDIWNHLVRSLGELEVRQGLTCHDDRDPGHVSIRGQRHLVWITRPCMVRFGDHILSWGKAHCQCLRYIREGVYGTRLPHGRGMSQGDHGYVSGI